ncbi:MAG: cytochrome [Actinobacteria bacterium 13_1_20CM_3_71_11]|nr:MAG: cytochrome [Actinobacteria bacterium 13_1_20CM_3_71_11]
MTETLPDARPIPLDRVSPFDPPPELGELLAHHPLSRLCYPDGHIGWLVTGYDLARQVLTDRRFSSRNDLLRPIVPLPVADEKGLRPVAPGTFIAMDPPEHTRYRRLLTGQFTRRRMERIEPRVTEIIDAHLDEMQRVGPPVDLVRSFASTIPSLVICELLGVPEDERQRVQHYSAMLVRLNATPDEAKAARQSFMDYITDLVRRKRSMPGDDLISAVLAAGELTEEELGGVCFLLLFGGHETTANMLGLGVYALLRNPDQTARLRADLSLMDRAVDDLLRYLSVVQMGTVRGALEDIELNGRLIRKGDSVCVSLPAVNRDPSRFTDPDRLDITRPEGGHLAFGYGIHRCIGEPLARLELRVGYTRLLQRLPNLRLAVPAEQVVMRTNMIIYGVHALPVTWDTT